MHSESQGLEEADTDITSEAVAGVEESSETEMASDDEVTLDTPSADEVTSIIEEIVEQAEDDSVMVDEEESQPAEPSDASLTDEEMFLAAINGDMPGTEEDDSFLLKSVKKGDIVTGVIASVNETEILIDIGAKSEGVITGQEFLALDQETLDSLSVGQELDVYVLRPEGRDGHTILSLRRALEQQDWDIAEEYLENKQALEVEVIGFNKGGLIVSFAKLRGFVPASQVSLDRRRRATGATPDERWREMVGESMYIKVIEVDRGRNRLILSEREAMKEQRAVMKRELLKKLEVGQVYTGRVTSLTDFGAFVDIGGIDGLVHLSELSWEHVTKPGEVLSVGEEVEVEVIDVNVDRERIGLSRKRRLQNPWERIEELYEVNQLVQGTVTKLTKFGAFARMVDQPAIEGLIHISELADRRIGHPREVVSEGDTLTLRVVRIEPDKKRIGLSLKRVDSTDYQDDDWTSYLRG